MQVLTNIKSKTPYTLLYYTKKKEKTLFLQCEIKL